MSVININTVNNVKTDITIVTFMGKFLKALLFYRKDIKHY